MSRFVPECGNVLADVFWEGVDVFPGRPCCVDDFGEFGCHF